MATQPNNPIVRVAQQDTILPSTQLNNKILPSTSVINVGYDANELVAAENLNYIFDNFGKWLTYLKEVGDSQIGAGDGLQTTSDSISGGQVLSVDNTVVRDPSTVVRQDRAVSAGNGLSGGGNLESNRTITLGTPSTVGNGSTNSVSIESHTHHLSLNESNIIIVTGVVNNGATIPLPSGYTQSQCRWFVSMNNDNINNTTWDVVQVGQGVHYRFECKVDETPVVTVISRVYRDGDFFIQTHQGSANYILIGVK